MNADDIIRSHTSLCDEILALMKEENRILRSTGNVPDSDFIERKKLLLPRLDESLERLRSIRETGMRVSDSARKQIESAQNKLMKIFMIDRENEQLLLKVTMPVSRMNAAPVIRKTTPGRLRKTYGA